MLSRAKNDKLTSQRGPVKNVNCRNCGSYTLFGGILF